MVGVKEERLDAYMVEYLGAQREWQAIMHESDSRGHYKK